MLDPRTLWLTVPEDRYEANPVLRRAERALFQLLRSPAPVRSIRTGERKEVRV